MFLYYQNVVFGGNPCGLGPQQFLVVCKDETLGGRLRLAPAPPPSSRPRPRPTTSSTGSSATSRASSTPGARTTSSRLTVQLISNALGLDQNLTNPLSAMFPTIPVGRCTLNGYTQAELDRLNSMYSHATG